MTDTNVTLEKDTNIVAELEQDIACSSFIKILIAIIVGWVLINIWTMFVKAFCFNFLGLNKNSWIHTGLVAVVCTILFVFYIRNSGKERCTIEGKMLGVTIPPTTHTNVITN